MDWQAILGLVTAIVSVIPTVVSVVMLIINIVKTKNWTLVIQITDAAMKVAEDYSRTHPGMSPDDKLNMCLEAVKAGLEAAGVKLDTDLLKRITDYIKETITWFNEMQDKETKELKVK